MQQERALWANLFTSRTAETADITFSWEGKDNNNSNKTTKTTTEKEAEGEYEGDAEQDDSDTHKWWILPLLISCCFAISALSWYVLCKAIMVPMVCCGALVCDLSNEAATNYLNRRKEEYEMV